MDITSGHSDYANARELVPVEGLRVIMVTQHDEVDYMCGEPAFVALHFEDGTTVKFIVEDDFRLSVSRG